MILDTLYGIKIEKLLGPMQWTTWLWPAFTREQRREILTKMSRSRSKQLTIAHRRLARRKLAEMI